MNRVTTTSTCGRCGATEVRDGAHCSTPVGWAFGLLTRETDAGPATLFYGFLCPPCQEVRALRRLPMPADTRTNEQISAMWTCNCASIAPTMPTCRIEHLADCNVTLMNAEVRRVARMTSKEKLEYLGVLDTEEEQG